MAEISKPAGVNIQWASAGDILNPGNTKYQTGWEVEIPPRQWENYLQNKQDKFIAHTNQHGVVVWDDETEYQTNKSYVQGPTNGIVYRCVLTHTNQDPELDVGNTYWTVAFSNPPQATETVQGIVELATTAEAEAGIDDERAMTPLKVKQAIDQFGNDDFNTTRVDVASATTVNLTTAAPNTRHINITGTTTISGFTVEAGLFYSVRFNGALTLTNSSALVTQTGENILTAAGDTCLLHASTTANEVEVLCYSRKNADYLNTSRATVASASVMDMSTLAPNTRHVNITGTTSITQFTGVQGMCYVLRFGGAITLVESANLTTNTGGDINAIAGDSCVIRLNQAGVSEVLMFTVGKNFARSADIPFVVGGAFSFTHSLGRLPKKVRILYKCLIAQNGYGVGEILDVGNWISSDNSVGSYGVSTFDITTTGLNGRFGNTRTPRMPVKTTGGVADSTAANWALVIEVTA